MTSHAADSGMVMAGGDDTIVALATPPGRSALAVVRLSGPGAHAVAGRVAAPWPLPERTARLCSLRDPASGALIDRGIVTTYAAGRSYTGEPMVEIATHGGHLVPALAMAALVRAGAREALPGEFTRRAVLNGKLDLVRAEAVGDLIDARSGLMHQAALSQLDGGLSRRVEELRQALIDTEALIAYDIDFPDEDDGPIDRGRILASCDAVLGRLDALISTAPAGELVREGAIVVLAGAPNAGKSSLYNALLGEARAIVTDIPGTTRDALEATIDAEGWPLRLVDTAGLRDSADALERLGIEASERYLARAHVILACGETPAAVAATAVRVARAASAPILGVHTKRDLVPNSNQPPQPEIVTHRNQSVADSSPVLSRPLSNPTSLTAQHQGASADSSSEVNLLTHGTTLENGHDLVTNSYNSSPVADGVLVSNSDQPGLGRSPRADQGSGEAQAARTVAVSAITGDGLPKLRRAIVATLAERYGAPTAEVPMLTRARHARALEAARVELASFREAWAVSRLPAPVAAVHLREAVVALETLIGAVGVEDVLDRVFSAFCVGK